MFVIPYTTSSRNTVSPHTAHGFGRAFDRLFDATFERQVNDTANASSVRTPAMDVSESDTAYTVVFDVPGASKALLKVTVEGRRVSIETAEASVAEAAAESACVAEGGAETPSAAPVQADAKPAQRALYRERTAARYARTVSLPAEVDQASSQARFENGVLTLTLTKRVPTGATRLNVD